MNYYVNRTDVTLATCTLAFYMTLFFWWL